jgi:16S rRNA G966 N2-methylase RsmD
MERMRKTDHKASAGVAAVAGPKRGTNLPKVPILRQERRKQAFSVFGGAVEQAGDAETAAALAEMLAPDPGLARALTHGFHSYAGRMHPSTARLAIARFSQPGQDVLDPFCGSGTVLVEAMAAGRRAKGSDASPLAVIIAQVRSSTLGPEGRQRLVEDARQIAETAAERARKRQRPEIPSWARRESDRFFPHVAFELYGLRALIGETKEDDVGRALRACLSSILVKFMRGSDEAEARRIGRGVPSHFFAGRAEELARGLEALERRTPAGTPVPQIRVADARDLGAWGARRLCRRRTVAGGDGNPSRVPISDGLADNKFDLILSSPPYAGTYDYAEHHDVRFLWLGLPRDNLDRVQVGARDEGLGSAVQRWRHDRQRWLSEMARVARRGAAIILQVGDGVVAGAPEDAACAVEDEARRMRLVPVARVSQARPPHDYRLRQIFAGHPRREHVVMLRKP